MPPNQIFKTTYQEFIYKRTYARYLQDEKRRENWNETVERYGNFFREKINALPIEKEASFAFVKAEYEKAIQDIKNLSIVPSMRALWTAGEALKRDNIAGYNCAALIIDKPKAFADLLYILMNGAGAGISVERQYVTKLPEIPEHFTKKKCEPIVFEDSKLGWAQGFYEYLTKLYEGVICEYDLSLLRPKGALLKTFGGRASGPAPLEELLKFVTNTFLNARGRKLNSLECHDICCYVAKVIVVGGVRRSAILSLSNRSDDRIAHAKDGEFWNINPQRMLANNSIAYTEKPSMMMFFEDWLNLMRSNSGERGIFNRESADFIVSQIGRRDTGKEWLCNPCSEIILRPQEFCNLTEVIVRPEDTKESLCEKVHSATIIGCLQSTLTKFNFIGREWKKNCEEERLLGVSLTGLMDHPTLNTVSKDAKVWLTEMKQTAIETAREWSFYLGINMPAAITCTKPSGTVSQLVNCASGIHPRQYQYYIRRIRVAKMDPIANFLIDVGVPYNPEVGETLADCNNYVFDFPQEAPEFAVTADEVTAIDQLNYWLMIQKHWCEHKPSVTIYVGENEWLEVGAWVYKNWKWVSGISFLPRNGGVYQLAPYEEIDKETYEALSAKMPVIDFTKLAQYEKVDSTEGAKSYACSAGGCEI